ncbi:MULTISPECIES: ABC transporter substrate-binding protein [Gulbenkiania]|uniref:ABC-type transport system, periplasmic component n=2 Tax=Gulbenkiania TaxID=397456 RepID=A0A0K6GWS1_9NEIS|nr:MULTISPECIES: ABC transporter substrate-binding protein [Gulbenkiania]TCW33049.1 dipeptide transport system substrate-binding protein [Gulbenkiania mobilis]CUA83166.1 ABC-type transport system, periplasmic component [Gulbenkiania indica]
MHTVKTVVRKTTLALALSVLSLPALAASTLVYCSAAAPEGFDPALYAGADTHDATAETVFNRLVRIERGGNRVVPDLAVSWTVSPDARDYTFQLRPGVKFHHTADFVPTRTLNADDVVFTFSRFIDPKHPLRGALPSVFPQIGMTSFDSNIEKIEKVDAMTVRITLKKSDTSFLNDLTWPFASVHSAEYAQKLIAENRAAELNQKPVGTGPFVFRSYQKDSAIRYAANPDYFRSKPRLDNLVFAITPDATVRVQKLLRNECQLIIQPKPTDLASLSANRDVVLRSTPALAVGYLNLNLEKVPQLKDVRVREALALAIDRKGLLSQVYLDAARPASSLVPPPAWAFDPTLKPVSQDVALARKKLAEAGLAEGFSMELWAMPVTRLTQPNGKLTAEMIQADWAKIGVKTDIKTIGWGEYIKMGRSGGYKGAMVLGTGGTTDPASFLGMMNCGGIDQVNFSRWCNKNYDALFARAKAERDPNRRAALYRQAQGILMKELPLIPLAYPNAYAAWRKTVHGYTLSADGRVNFEGVWIK